MERVRWEGQNFEQLQEVQRLEEEEEEVLWSIFGPKKDEETVEWRKQHSKEHNDLY